MISQNVKCPLRVATASWSPSGLYARQVANKRESEKESDLITHCIRGFRAIQYKYMYMYIHYYMYMYIHYYMYMYDYTNIT